MNNSTTHNSNSLEYLSIQEVAGLVGKSIQTVRRLVKSKKLKTKKKKTPQGFRYLVDKKSVLNCFGLKDETASVDTEPVDNKINGKPGSNKSTLKNQMPKSESITESTARVVPPKSNDDNGSKEEASSNAIEDNESPKITIEPQDFKSFVKTLDNLVLQHGEERQNFLRLVNTLQEQVFVLENKINMLQAPKKKWYKFWA